jgi:predicted Zn-dependent protease with MMP-like domain
MKENERLSRERFHALAEAELASIPKPLRDLLVNVAVEIKDAPGIEADDMAGAGGLLGLYTGPTRHEMLSGDASGVLPAKIYLYQRAIEDESSTLAALKQELRLTLRRELAHHFGFDDDELARRWPEGA